MELAIVRVAWLEDVFLDISRWRREGESEGGWGRGCVCVCVCGKYTVKPLQIQGKD